MDEQEIRIYRQQYGTPDKFFYWVENDYICAKFTIDVCASPHNAKCEKFYTEFDDGLRRDWGNPGDFAWCNPEFKEAGKWLEKAYEQARRGVRSCVLTHWDHSTEWFEFADSHATSCAMIAPRINFDQHPLLIEHMAKNGIKPSGNDKQNALWYFDDMRVTQIFTQACRYRLVQWRARKRSR